MPFPRKSHIYLSCCLLDLFLSEKKGSDGYETKSGLRYVGIIRSLAISTHFYNLHAMPHWQPHLFPPSAFSSICFISAEPSQAASILLNMRQSLHVLSTVFKRSLFNVAICAFAFVFLLLCGYEFCGCLPFPSNKKSDNDNSTGICLGLTV